MKWNINTEPVWFHRSESHLRYEEISELDWWNWAND